MRVLRVIDSKFGRHRVYASYVTQLAAPDPVTGVLLPEVRRPNLQLACYALGVLQKFALWREYTHVTMIIVQPFIDHTDEYTCTIEELLVTQEFLRQRAEETRKNPQFRPSADTCHFCLRSGNCAEQDKAVLETALVGFEDVDTATPAPMPHNKLGSLYAAIPMIQSWCDAVATRVRQTLLEGQPVVRNDGLAYKLIEGRATRRTWTDEDEVELSLVLDGLDEDHIYAPRKLRSPAQLERLSKSPRAKKGELRIPPVIPPEQWSRLQSYVTQGQAQPTIVLETDPNPALAPVTDGFDDVPEEDDLFN